MVKYISNKKCCLLYRKRHVLHSQAKSQKLNHTYFFDKIPLILFRQNFRNNVTQDRKEREERKRERRSKRKDRKE